VRPLADDGGPGDVRLGWGKAESLPDGRGGEHARAVEDGRSVGDSLPRVDLAAHAGDPCTFGQCGLNLICGGGTCLTMCTQPTPACNDKVATCGPNEACLEASSFTDACYPATAQPGQPCSDAICVAGSLCVEVRQGTKTLPPKCLKLYQYGCGGAQAAVTDNGCKVCLE
jgi:hypothetical protein